MEGARELAALKERGEESVLVESWGMEVLVRDWEGMSVYLMGRVLAETVAE